jgi:CHAT domain-containing protein
VPVHAAGIYAGPDRECCADYAVSSYTPTLAALLRAQQGEDVYMPENMKLLAIAVEKTLDHNLPPLHHVVEEANTVTMVATQARVLSSPVTNFKSKRELLEAFASAGMVHLACHGIQDSSEPHQSHFALSNGRLTVAELMELDLRNSFLAFLSACETAKGDTKHIDEVVHLAATMLFAGFKSVVATMW